MDFESEYLQFSGMSEQVLVNFLVCRKTGGNCLLVPHTIYVTVLVDYAEDKLFHKILSDSNHVLLVCSNCCQTNAVNCHIV